MSYFATGYVGMGLVTVGFFWFCLGRPLGRRQQVEAALVFLFWPLSVLWIAMIGFAILVGTVIG